ncbi:MAG: TRAP transporter small permease [Deltaproteobacteria bacterium]|nr:TRAP transporter small permease [Deltaproteobacteria bacterium]
MHLLEKINQYISRWFNGIALAALSAMLFLVAVDVIGAKVLSLPVSGAMDLTSLLGLLIIGFSMTQTYMEGRHITVDFLIIRANKRLRNVLRCLNAVLCMVFFLFVVWRLFLYAHDLQMYGEKSLTVKIPLFPFAYALGVAFVPMLLAVPIQLYRKWKGSRE